MRLLGDMHCGSLMCITSLIDSLQTEGQEAAHHKLSFATILILFNTKLTSKRTDVSRRAPGEHKYEQEEPRKTHKEMEKIYL